jgi:hypothetical protein
MVTVTLPPNETVVPNAKEALRVLDAPLAVKPDVGTLRLQSAIRMTAPLINVLGGVKVDAVMVKMQEPKVVTPVAVFPPEAMLKAGDVAVLVNKTVVAAVVPRPGTPDENTNGVLATALATVGFTAAVRLAVAATTGAGALLPPPQAASAAVVTAARMNLEALNIMTFFPVS